jgi:hypothetical protein
MKSKDYLVEKSKGLLQELNQFLEMKGIATKEMPFFIRKVQFGLKESLSHTANKKGIKKERKCVQWDSRLVERTNPATGEKYWLLEEWCIRYEDAD